MVSPYNKPTKLKLKPWSSSRQSQDKLAAPAPQQSIDFIDLIRQRLQAGV